MNLVVAYDIADPRRLQRIAKIMEDYGVRVQKSVFEVEIAPNEMRGMQRRIKAKMDPQEDGVKYFPLCQRCASVAFAWGPDAPDLPEGPYMVL